MQVTLDEDISDFNETAYRIELAALYGVPLEYIVLSATPASLVLHISIKPPPGQLPPNDNVTATSILDRVASITPSDLSSALGTNVTAAEAPSAHNVTTTVVAVVEVYCPSGSYCSAGNTYSCPPGTFSTGRASNCTVRAPHVLI